MDEVTTIRNIWTSTDRYRKNVRQSNIRNGSLIEAVDQIYAFSI